MPTCRAACVNNQPKSNTQFFGGHTLLVTVVTPWYHCWVELINPEILCHPFSSPPLFVCSVLCVVQLFTLTTCVRPLYCLGSGVSVKGWWWRLFWPKSFFECPFSLCLCAVSQWNVNGMLLPLSQLCLVLCLPHLFLVHVSLPLVFLYLPQVWPPLWLVLLAERLLTVWLSFWLLWCLFAILAAPGPPP